MLKKREELIIIQVILNYFEITMYLFYRQLNRITLNHMLHVKILVKIRVKITQYRKNCAQ